MSEIYCCWPLPGSGSRICSGLVGNGVAVYISTSSWSADTMRKVRVGDLSFVWAELRSCNALRARGGEVEREADITHYSIDPIKKSEGDKR